LYAYLLDRCGNYEAAEDYYLQSLESNPNNAACLMAYGNLLSEIGFANEAEQFYTRGSKNTEGNINSTWNYWASNEDTSSPRKFTKKKKKKKLTLRALSRTELTASQE